MKVQDSICTLCKHFWHECGVPEFDYDCIEYCYHPDKKVVARFNEEFNIHECKGYEQG